jgi:hypothetical protein
VTDKLASRYGGSAEHTPRARLSRPAKTYLVAFTVTNTGVGGFTLAIGLTLFTATGSATAFSIAVAAEYLLGLVGQIIGGSILDRWPLLPVALVCNTVRGLAVLLGGLLVLVTHSATPALVAFLAVSVLRPIYRAASFSLVGRVCQPDELVRVNSMRFGLLQIAQFGGLALVSGLNAIAGSPSAVIGVSVLFLAGSALLLRLSPHVRPLDTAADPSEPPQSAWRSVVQSWRELARAVRSVPTVIIHLLLGGVAPVVTSLIVVLVAPVNAEMGGGAVGIALLDGGATLGALAAVLFARRFLEHRMPLVLVASLVLAVVGLLGVAMSGGLVPATLSFLVLGLSIALGATASDTLLQLRSAPQILGRIAISQEFVVSFLAVLFLPAFGVLGSSAGFDRASLVYAGVVGAFLVLLLLSLRVHRERLFFAPLPVPDRGSPT